MKRERFPWKTEYQFVEPGITAEGVRIYPFDPAFPVDVSFLTASGNSLVRMNRHEFFEIMYIFSGTTQIQVRSRCLQLKKGDVVVMGARHLSPLDSPFRAGSPADLSELSTRDHSQRRIGR